MRVAVTGASGFVGRHVVAELLVRNVQTSVVTRHRDRVAGLFPGIRIVEMDISKPPHDAYVELDCPTVLIHLAWEGLPHYRSLHHFEQELPNHYLFLKNLLLAGLPSLLATGTCFEYGMQSGPLSEELATKPANPYAYAKDALRKQLHYLRATHHFAFTWARLFYMYGEGQAPSSLYPALQAAFLRGDAVFNMSGGEQLRDYLPIEDVATQIVELALNHADAGIVNVCSGRPVSVRCLVDGWLEHWNKKMVLNYGYYPYPDYEPMAFWGDRRRFDAIVNKKHND